MKIEEGFITDKAGNTNLEETILTFQTDNTAPNISVAVTNTTTNSITVSITAQDIGPAGLVTENTYTYYLSQEPTFPTESTTMYISNETTQTFTELAQNIIYYIKAETKDNQGNIGTSTTISSQTGTVPTGSGNITITNITWNQNATATTPGSAYATICTSKTGYILEYQLNSVQEGKWTQVTESTVTLAELHHKDKIYARLKDTSGNPGAYTTFDIMDAIEPTPATLMLKENDEEGTSYVNNSWTEKNVYITLHNGTDNESGIQKTEVTKRR